MSNLIPTRKLQITNPANAVEEMIAYGNQLKVLDERPWFEVRFPVPEHLSDEEKFEWIREQENHFDAVEIIDGEVCTLPPYKELITGVK